VNPANPASKLALEQTEAAARAQGLGKVARVEAETAEACALRPVVFSGTDAVVIIPDLQLPPALLNRARLPAIYPERDYSDEGGLMAYGANVTNNFRRAAVYVDRILKGPNPATSHRAADEVRASHKHEDGPRSASPSPRGSSLSPTR
jgi:putative ABC transport system substrate-binding protein